ncbi:MAG: AmmeMemoRadiSam system protein B [Candidatus Edwardsbacteria bacterium]|nr:AmmeMemoRadiSam system protein B [Candidatus Edwardsbacteria bacterium]MBU1577685.1 AmmeMemoRadiSam system protein B [Candidatus Edwardsbacteria bacterium]MBU2463571.1 AmmeMemoRadiSam system protein B [Candidatus Edwardsbacteria bacterium]MBU2594582.1 AmmeMemoRadiSam system protein B [Candidatus Edwardsbacteria bacterium]
MSIRRSIIAGSWYPGDADTLSAQIKKYLDAAKRTESDELLTGIIVPHAGYMYSGPTAAYAYKNISPENISTVIMVGPSHSAYFEGAAVYGFGAWETPLGKAEIDSELAEEIISQDPKYIHDNPGAHAKEHSLEIQLPFLQSVLKPGFRIVPIMLYDQSLASCDRLAQAIAGAVKGRDDVLLLASSDLSHYHSHAEAKKLDKLVVDAVRKYDPEKLAGNLAFEKCEACGGGPVVTVMLACRYLGADKSVVYDYRTSGDVTGDKGQVVGYLAAGLYDTKNKKEKIKDKKTEAKATESDKLTIEEKKELFRIAHASIEAAVKGQDIPKSKPLTARLAELRGVFVTLKEAGNLRGCIGYIEGIRPLYQAVAEMAVAAATGDPRFPAVTEKELSKLEYEISVLTPKRQIGSPDEFIVGKHGIIVQQGGRSGVFLPQVAPEEGWNREETLSYLCLHKAGLPANAWKDKETKLFVFEAEVLEERDLI